MEESINAAITTDAPVTESAPVEVSAEDNSVDSSEKTPNTQEGTQDSQEMSSQRDDDGQLIPKTRLDEVISERNELRRKMQEFEARQQEAETKASMTPDEQAQQQQLEVAKETLKKLGFVTKEEQEKTKQEEKAANMFISECNRLEGKYDGKDGQPAFKATEIAEFMDELASKGQYISDPETAYKLKNIDAIAEAKAKAQRSSTFSERQAGGMNQVTDERKSELEAASKAGDLSSFLKKYAPMPKN